MKVASWAANLVVASVVGKVAWRGTSMAESSAARSAVYSAASMVVMWVAWKDASTAVK